ncbi:MAG: arginine deiminase family protein [Pseudomonadota bacterium]
MGSRFTQAIVREPGRSVVSGLRAGGGDDPTFEGVLAEHGAYVAALKAAGVSVTELEPLEAFPDSIFVEDPALVFPAGAIVLRPGAESRAGEADVMRPVLNQHFDTVLELGHGFVDGGDVLVTPGTVMIGLSARTDRAGADSLIGLLAQLGLKGEVFHTPPGVLHFKSDCSLLDDETVLATPTLAASGAFEGFKVLLTPKSEEGAANALRVNDALFVGAQFPQTIAMLRDSGYAVVPLPTEQIAKIDAGLSCMSLRW